MLENIELKLLAGYKISTEAGDIHQPKIIDIVDISESKYNQYLSILLYDTELLEIPQSELDKVGEITTFDFLAMQSSINDEFGQLVTDALSFFFKEPVYLLEEYGAFYLGSIENLETNPKCITRDNYKDIKKVIIKMNYLKHLEEEEELEFANDMAREWYLNIKKLESKTPQPQPQVNLHSIISALKWKGNKSIDEMLNMSVYQLYDGYHRLFLIDETANLTQGIYAGTIDGKEIKSSQLNWAKIIKTEKD